MKMGADGGRGDSTVTQAVIVAGLGDEDHGEFRMKATAVGLAMKGSTQQVYGRQHGLGNQRPGRTGPRH